MENHILLIDDDEDESILLEMVLQQCTKRAKVHQVRHFEQAVTFADTFLPTPNLIFLDLRLPATNGLDILAWIRSHNRLRDVPVVIWSHSASEEEIEQSSLRGSSYFLSKTADQSAIRKSVDHICENWLQ
ncbi:response regulator [Spirosoma arcticum]